MENQTEETTPLKFTDKIAHFKAGYDNQQAVARFMDTKASAVVAGAVTLIGLMVAYCSWLIKSITKFPECSCLFILVSVATVVLLLWGIFLLYRAVTEAFLCIVPRKTSKEGASCLFPYIPSEDDSKDDVGLLARRTANMERVDLLSSEQGTEEDAVEDYARQLKRMGEINYHKIIHSENAIGYLQQLIGVALGIVVSGGILYSLFKISLI